MDVSNGYSLAAQVDCVPLDAQGKKMVVHCGSSTYAAECVPLFDFLLVMPVLVYKKSLKMS
jgi:hypothetical protein